MIAFSSLNTSHALRSVWRISALQQALGGLEGAGRKQRYLAVYSCCQCGGTSCHVYTNRDACLCSKGRKGLMKQRKLKMDGKNCAGTSRSNNCKDGSYKQLFIFPSDVKKAAESQVHSIQREVVMLLWRPSLTTSMAWHITADKQKKI